MSNVSVPSQLPTGEFERLLELLRLHYAFPLPIPLSGKYFELLFAKAVKGTQEEQKLLFDVHRDGTGWSLKTFQTRNNKFEVVIQRCDILKDPMVSLADPVERLGQKILERFSAFIHHSADRQAVIDPRLGFLLRDKSERNFVFFQQAYKTYAPGDVQWRWANDEHKSIMGFVDSQLTFR